MKVYHGAELYAEWTKRGGTLEGWREIIAPQLMRAGKGPHYRMSDETYESLFATIK